MWKRDFKNSNIVTLMRDFLNIEKIQKQRAQRNFLLTNALYKQTFNDNIFLKIFYKNLNFEMIDLIEQFCHLNQLHHIVNLNWNFQYINSFVMNNSDLKIFKFILNDQIFVTTEFKNRINCFEIYRMFDLCLRTMQKILKYNK